METNLSNINFDLISSIVCAVQRDRWNIELKSIYSANNFSAIIFNEITQIRLRIYISHLIDGGGCARTPDEYRVQFKSVDRFIEEEGEKTLILGWWKGVGVFAGFDYTKHSNKIWNSKDASPSSQIKEETLRKALLNGFAPYEKGNNEIAIAFRPDFFVSYVQNLEELHGFGASKREFKVLEEVASGELEINSKEVKKLAKQRQIVITTIKRKIRESDFNDRVLTAYKNKCAFSGLQLKLVDAAHIIPVSDKKSTDETSNGIALSALYHRAFDRGLVTFNDQYQIIVNSTEMKKLKEIGFDGGMEKFIKDLRPIINVPPAINDRPNINFIREANKMRGWKI